MVAALEPVIHPKLRPSATSGPSIRPGGPGGGDTGWPPRAGEAASQGDATVQLDPTHYVVLGLPEEASTAEIQRAIVAQGLDGMPGVAGVRGLASAQSAQRLAAAVLSDGSRKHVYDQWLQRERRVRAQVQATAQARQAGLRRFFGRRTALWLLAALAAWLVWSLARG